jgi:hypothetical protein
MIGYLLFFIIACSFFVVLLQYYNKNNSSKNYQTHTVDRYTSASPIVTPNQVYQSFSGGLPHPILGVDCANADCPSTPCASWESCPYNDSVYTVPEYGYGLGYDYGYPMGYGYRSDKRRFHRGGSPGHGGGSPGHGGGSHGHGGGHR